MLDRAASAVVGPTLRGHAVASKEFLQLQRLLFDMENSRRHLLRLFKTRNKRSFSFQLGLVQSSRWFFLFVLLTFGSHPQRSHTRHRFKGAHVCSSCAPETLPGHTI
eukprot:1469110-Amphidinium_carterae.1